MKKDPDAESFMRNNVAAYEKNDNASHDDLMMRDLIDFAIEYGVADRKMVTGKTIDRYIAMLEDSFIFYSASRYDIKGRQLLIPIYSVRLRKSGRHFLSGL